MGILSNKIMGSVNNRLNRVKVAASNKQQDEGIREQGQLENIRNSMRITIVIFGMLYALKQL